MDRSVEINGIAKTLIMLGWNYHESLQRAENSYSIDAETMRNVFYYLDNIKKFHHYNSEVPPYNNLNVIEKKTFGSTVLQTMLEFYSDEIEEITFMGVCTGICVLSNAILAKATLPEVPVNVVADCCACVTPESHKTALEAMKLCQINVM